MLETFVLEFDMEFVKKQNYHYIFIELCFKDQNVIDYQQLMVLLMIECACL